MADVRETVNSLKSKLMRARDRAEKARKDTSAAVSQALQAVEVSGTAFGLAYARGRFGTESDDGHLELAVLGMPVGLLSGIAGHAVAFMGIAGEYSEHVHNVSDGCLAEYSVQQGQNIGLRQRIAAGEVDGATYEGPRTLGRIGRQHRGLGAGMPRGYARHNPAAAYARRG